MDKKLIEFFEDCVGIKRAIGGCIMVAKNEESGYGNNGIFQLEKVEDGYKLVDDMGANPEYLEYVFNDKTIKKYELGGYFGKFANVYIDDTNYIHIHIKLLD